MGDALDKLAEALSEVPAEALKAALVDAVSRLQQSGVHVWEGSGGCTRTAASASEKKLPLADRKTFAPSVLTQIAPPTREEHKNKSPADLDERTITGGSEIKLSPAEKKANHAAKIAQQVEDSSPADAESGVSVAGCGISKLALELYEDLLKRKKVHTRFISNQRLLLIWGVLEHLAQICEAQNLRLFRKFMQRDDWGKRLLTSINQI